MRTIAIVQARMGSSRLPGKALVDVAGRPLLWYVLQRTRLARSLDEVIVATPNTPEDRLIHALCDAWGVAAFAGDRDDVLARYVAVANLRRLDGAIVRLTGDCPCIDPDVIDATVAQLKGHTWASNIDPRVWPDGLDVEVFTAARLEQLDRETTDLADREHVTPALYRGERGGTLTCPVRGGLGHLRWTVDTPADLAWVRTLYARLQWNATWQQILFADGGLGLRSAA